MKAKQVSKIYPMSTIAAAELRELKERSQLLKPVVIIGQAGLTNEVLQEIDSALNAHELIKLRLAAEDNDLRVGMVAQICSKTKSILIQTIGHVASIYRKNPEE